MVGNKAKKAIAAALSGAMVLSAAAPAIAGVWTDTTGESWYRINGDHTEAYQLGTLDKDAKEMADDDQGAVAQSGLVVKGQDRYDTMFDTINYNASLYEDVWVASENITEIVLTSGESQADTLAAAGFAATLNNGFGSPVITTPAGRLGIQAERAIRYYAEGQTAGEKQHYDKLKVYIVGGEAAVSSAVEDAIKAIEDKDDNAVEVERVAGADRVATSLEVAKQGDDEGWLDEDLEKSANYIYIANGTAWADALSVSSVAYMDQKPILLTQADGTLSADQIAYLRKHDSVTIKVVGGPALPSVQQLYDEGFTRARVEYIGGVNRYETSAKVIEERYRGADPAKAVAVASGNDAHWADALVGGVFVGANGGVLALVDGVDEVTALKEAYKYFDDSNAEGSHDAEGHAYANATSFIIGGESAIDSKFAEKLNKNFPINAE